MNSLNGKFDAFVEKQEMLELRVTTVEVCVTSQEKAVEGVVEMESIDFTAEKVTNVWHSLETLQKSLTEATCEIANSHIAISTIDLNEKILWTWDGDSADEFSNTVAPSYNTVIGMQRTV